MPEAYRLEEIATLKRHSTITYKNDKDEFTKVEGRIVDIYAANGADWCKLSDDTVIRLDKIEGFELD